MENKNEFIESLTETFFQFKKKMQQKMQDNLTGNITFAQLIILKNIDLGYRTVKDIAAKLTVSPPAASKLVDQLYNQELVERSRSKTDRRIVYIKLTDVGKRTLEDNEKKRMGIFKDQFEKLTAEELQVLNQVLEKLSDS